jgi:hypothetical protein
MASGPAGVCSASDGGEGLGMSNDEIAARLFVSMSRNAETGILLAISLALAGATTWKVRPYHP